MKKKLLVALVIVLCLALVGACITAQAANDDHTCGHVCSVCGKCLDKSCTNSACSQKCAGHQPLPHACSRTCSVCGKCLDATCTDPACAEKCSGHLPTPHGTTCSRTCSVCGKCLNATCTDPACAEKCPGHQGVHGACSRVCSICGYCLDYDCTNPACATKCQGHGTLTGIEITENAKVYSGLTLADCVGYRRVYSDGRRGPWEKFTASDFATYTVKDGKIDTKATLVTKGHTFTVDVHAEVSDATVASVAMETAPAQTEYFFRGTAYSALNLFGGKIKITYDDGNTVVTALTKSMLASGTLGFGDSNVPVTFGGKTTSFKVTTRALSVSEFKQKSSGSYDMEGIVLGPVSIRNSTTGPVLIVKDVDSNELIGIYYANGGTNTAPSYDGLKAGDRIICSVTPYAWGTDDSYGAGAGTKCAYTVSKSASGFKSNVLVVSHDNDYSLDFTDPDIVSISTQAELSKFILAKNNHYKIVKLTGLKGVDGGTYGMRIFLDENISKYGEQMIHFASDDSCSPVLEYYTERFYLGEDWFKYFMAGNNTYANPYKASSDVYAVYVGGTNWYEVFHIFDPSWFASHDCATEGHIFGAPAYYTGTADALQAYGTCQFCHTENLPIGSPVTVAKGDIVAEVSATCTEDGFAAHYYNAESKMYFDADGKYVLESSLVITKLGHSFGTATKIVGTDVHTHTCTREGCNFTENEDCTYNQSDVCTVCGGAKPSEAHVHAYTEEVVNDMYLASSATCQTLATYYKSCICGEFERNAENTFSAGVYADHDYGTLIPAGTDTCIGALDAHYECSVCHALFDQNKGETDADALMLPITEHSYTKYRWRNITNSSNLKAGDKIILTNYGATLGMSLDNGTTYPNNRGLVSMTTKDDPKLEVITLENSSISGYYKLKTSSGKYVRATSSGEKFNTTAYDSSSPKSFTYKFSFHETSSNGWYARITNDQTTFTYKNLAYNSSRGFMLISAQYSNFMYVWKFEANDWTSTTNLNPASQGYYTCKCCGGHFNADGTAIPCEKHVYKNGTCAICGATEN